VLETLLDEGLYFLEQERENILRDAEVAKVTSQAVVK